MIYKITDYNQKKKKFFAGQLSNGVFENSYVGKTELMFEGEFEV